MFYQHIRCLRFLSIFFFLSRIQQNLHLQEKVRWWKERKNSLREWSNSVKCEAIVSWGAPSLYKFLSYNMKTCFVSSLCCTMVINVNNSVSAIFFWLYFFLSHYFKLTVWSPKAVSICIHEKKDIAILVKNMSLGSSGEEKVSRSLSSCSSCLSICLRLFSRFSAETDTHTHTHSDARARTHTFAAAHRNTPTCQGNVKTEAERGQHGYRYNQMHHHSEALKESGRNNTQWNNREGCKARLLWVHTAPETPRESTMGRKYKHQVRIHWIHKLVII